MMLPYLEQLKSWSDQFNSFSMHNVTVMSKMLSEYVRYNELVLDSINQKPADGNHVEPYKFDGQDYNVEVHLPKGYDPSKKYPCVVAIHGCMQNVDKLVESTRLNEIADEKGFIVVYPEQKLSENPINCWNWMAPENHQKYSGEPYRIINGIETAISKYSIDRENINLTGISSGGAISMTLACLYPEYFNAVAIHAGLKHDSADTIPEAFRAMDSGKELHHDKKTDIQTQLTNHAVSAIIFHGTNDQTVNIKNVEHIVQQIDLLNNAITHTHTGIKSESEIVEKVKPLNGKYGYTVEAYSQPDNASIKVYKIDGMDHAWSGGTNTLYSDPKGPDSTSIMLDFFEDSYFRHHPEKDPNLLERHIQHSQKSKPVVSMELAFGL